MAVIAIRRVYFDVQIA